MFNKDLYIKTFDAARKEYEKRIALKDKIIEECLRVGGLKICKCAGKDCEALWIRGRENSFINTDRMGDCDCGKIYCFKHCDYLMDEYGNERFLCDSCLADRQKRIEENRRKWEQSETIKQEK